MRPGGVKWTKAEEAQMVAFSKGGYTYRMAAEELGRSVGAVQGKAAAMDLSFRHEPRARKSQQEIAERLHVPRPPIPQYASLTAMAFGDPPIGRSALDQKRAAS